MSWAAKTYTFSPSTTAASAEVNQNFDDAFTAINTAMPSGGIILWSGAIVDIPSGWYLCNGANSTPDLRNKFIVGAGDSYAVAATGGANSVTLNDTQIPAHTHSGYTGYTDVNHYHQDAGHTHVVEGLWLHSGNTEQVGDTNINAQYGDRTSNTGYASIGWQVGGTTNHRHSFTTDNGTGGGGSHENRPPYYALAWIRKS